jgi:hypothetical protein
MMLQHTNLRAGTLARDGVRSAARVAPVAPQVARKPTRIAYKEKSTADNISALRKLADEATSECAALNDTLGGLRGFSSRLQGPRR